MSKYSFLYLYMSFYVTLDGSLCEIMLIYSHTI